MANKNEYKDIREQLQKYNSSKTTAYMLVCIGFVGLVVTITILAIATRL